jgi:DNA polymerase III sliding clamp (beta) subunit (PCNA family)
VDLKSIVPTQRTVTIPNIESTKEVELYPILFKLNDRYYVLDGHHRITNAILKGEKEVMSYVYDYKAQNSDKFNNGGQLDLVDESKKGDHPSRDLNNYNDLMDVEADGQVGMENGLAFDEGGFMADVYAGGGQTLSAEVFEWDKVPTNYRNISKVKKVPFTNNPMDKGLDNIIAPFLGKDELRPVGMGINFDKNGITATDFHKLITLPYPNEKYEGIYDVNRVKKIKADQPILIDGNYPNYEAIIPKSNIISGYEVDVYKLLQYTKTAINYANKTTKGISFKFGDNERIGFNGSLLLEVLTASLKLGHEKLYAKITAPNRAMVLSPNKNYEVGNDDILLIMPIMLTSTFGTITGYGAEDIDYKRSLKAYYDFNDNEIHNADGSVAEFKIQYENNLSVDDSYLGLLNKMTSKKVYLPILQYVKVENGKMTATDLDVSLIIKDVNMPNGIYEIVNKAPNITMYPIEDFPKERVFKSNEVFVNHNGSKLVAFEFVTFSEVFEFYLDKLLLSVGKDDLRPVMSGICIKKTINNELFLVTTNAHTLCKINITEYCEFEKDDRELEYILPTKYLKDFIKLADGSLHFKCNLTNVFIEADNLEYIARAIDGKYPNYEAVIPKQNDKMIVFDHEQMNKCLKSKEYQELIAKYKGQKNIYFEFTNSSDKLFVCAYEDLVYNRVDKLVDELELCSIDFNFKEVDKTFTQSDSLFLLMPKINTPKENQYFTFGQYYFDVMLETITDTEVECYFTEPNRAYIFPIDAIDYKKTLPEEKTKQQPKKVAKAKKEAVNVEKEQVREAIETLLMLAEIEENEEQRKEIYEALEILNMLKEDSYEYGGALGKKLSFEPIRTPLN